MIETFGFTSAYDIAYVLAIRKETDRAFEWLQKAVDYKDSYLVLVGADPRFTNLHPDPRWTAFLQSMGRLPEQLADIEFNVTLPD